MTSAALRLLQLQQEFLERHSASSLADEFQRDDFQPRSEDEIAAEYEETLRRLLT